MSFNAELEKVNNNHFQQQLIQQILLESGVIRPEHIQKAIEMQKKYIAEGKEKLELLSYYIDQENYSLNIMNPVSNQLISEVAFPVKKKNKPDFTATDWFPVANNSVVIFSDEDCQDVDEVNWGSNEKIGLTVSKEFSYLQSQGTEKSFYFPVMNKLFYDSAPAEAINSLPIDMTVTPNKKNIYFTDRGGGILYIFDTEINKLSGAVHLRPAGHRKALNVTSTSDGRKIFVTDNETPGLFIIDAKNLKIKKQPLTYGNLGNILSDEQWLYMIIDKPNSSPELLVLDIHNLIVRASIQLRGELFSKVDDPYDLITISPSGKFLLAMTFVNYPSLFTPIINVIDLQSFQLVDQVFLNDRGKPTYISFAQQKPDELVKLSSGIIDVLIDMGYITEEHVIAALEKAEAEMNPTPTPQVTLNESEEDTGFGFVDETDEPEEDQTLSSAQKYPVLNQFDLDPSLLLAFKEEQMRYFSFLPINKIDGKLTLAVANPAHKHTLKQIIEQKFPDLEVVIIDFTLNEFNRFMKEFYSVIKEKYDSIIAKQMESQAQQTQQQNPNLPQTQQQAQEQNKNVPPTAKPEAPLPKIEAKKPPIPVGGANRPKTDLPPNLSANIPSDVRLAVREKLKTLDPMMLEEAIMAICLEDFTSIWGIEVPRENIEKHRNLIKKAREEILEKDYAFVKIVDLVGQFSLEIVINQEKLVVMLKTLSEIAQKQQANPQPKATTGTTAAKQTSEPNHPTHTEGKCLKCGRTIPPELDICSKCSRESDHTAINDDVRSPASPNPLANLDEGHLLIADQKNNRVIELNGTGQIVWQIGGKDKKELIYPHSAIRLRSGTTLVTDSETDKVIEYSKTGRVYWELTHREGFRDMFLRRPVHAIRLINGNTLVVDQGNHRVFEINHLDKIVWQYGITATVGCSDGRLYSPSYAQRISTGHTLITDTDNHRVIEIDENDKIVWQYGNVNNKLGSGYGSGRDQLNMPMFAIKLENNNILIVDTGNKRILEVNHDKHVVWFYATSTAQGSPIDINALKAYRLNNGHTVIISPDQLIEIGSQNQLVYIRQIEYLPKAPDFKESNISEEEDKIINDRIIKKTGDKAKQAVSNYVKNTSNLSEIELPLIDRTNHKVMVINRYKNAIWKFGESNENSDSYLERPQYAELIKDEYVLVADTDNHRVIKVYRPTKEIVWQYGISGAMGSGNNQLGHPRAATVTPDNNILISDQYSSRVIEVNMEKEIVWSCGGWEGGNNFINAPYYAERLKNNNTLITDWSNHIVIEVDSQGNIIWQYGTPKAAGNAHNQLMYPEKAIRTEQGNTIIVDTRNNRILEVNDAGRVVWEFINYRVGNTSRQLSNPTNVFRLDNGHTVIIHNSNKQIIEINKNSEVVWQYQTTVEKKI